MIQLALRIYHVPEDIQVILDDYFSGFRMRVSTSDYTTNWINLEVGIAMGCTISPILFLMAKAADDSAGPANLGGGCSMPLTKTFMDDTTIICSQEEETRRMLARLDTLIAWCRVKFKPKKSRIESIEAIINKYTRKWLGVPPGLSDVAMYCRKAKLKLPMKSNLDEYKCENVRLVTMLEDSDDPVVKTVQPSIKTGKSGK
ncbi:reverse transcriptase [Elysia marginata]|uniref:Reverse transcriptase n=1 Tax=Elysia marginata TaxID=1093978 RepID=A0AAV4HWQ8_9GAST|nr:reverse transcriptase [Elysia marginata]